VATDESSTVVTSTIIDSSNFTDFSCKAIIKSGTNGQKYKITFKITSNEGNIYEESVYMIVKDSVLFTDIKAILRISNTAYDAEITDLILSAKADLGICGLLETSEIDPLIKRAITLYCKANFGFDNSDSAKLQQSYEMLRNHLSLSTDYAYFKITFMVKDSSNVAIRTASVTFDNEVKETNASGIAEFYRRVGSNYEYEVNMDGYISDSDDDNLIDVVADTSVNITLEV
jgi:hypothetical protein